MNNSINGLAFSREGIAGVDALNGNDVFDALSDFILYAKSPITFFSKPPGDWFPLVNNEVTVVAGTLLGSVVDYKVVDAENGGLWLLANTVAPGWFSYDATKVTIKKKDTNVTLSQDQKDEIIRSIITQTVPAAGLVFSAAEVVGSTVELAEGTLSAAAKLIKYLPWIAVGIGGVIVYVKYGDDIKKAFTRKTDGNLKPSPGTDDKIN